MKRLLALLPLLLLPACVSVPLPPVNIDWFDPQIPSLKDK